MCRSEEQGAGKQLTRAWLELCMLSWEGKEEDEERGKEVKAVMVLVVRGRGLEVKVGQFVLVLQRLWRPGGEDKVETRRRRRNQGK